jgi:NAD(P)-dependent dehydrogenase (short-subunit alcohol dehydrogenase family)
MENPMSATRNFLITLSLAWVFAVSPALAGKGTVLITGANRGIGLALAEQFVEAGYQVIGTARKPAKATELEKLGARVEQLDVAEPDSVAAMAKRLQNTPIDILVNNAGITGHMAADLAATDIEQLDWVFQVNSLGPLRVTQALLPMLDSGDKKQVVNISSMMGSMELNTWGGYIGYRGSKAALNSFNQTLAVEMGKQGYVFVVMHPGYVQTEMNKGAGEISPQESATGIFKVIEGLKPSDNGAFYDNNGKAMPW